MRPPIDVAPEEFDAASKVFGQDLAKGIEGCWSRLTGSLNGTASMAGSDPGGEAWAKQYDPAAQDTVSIITDLSNACVQLAALLEQTGFNHGMAESASDPTRSVPTPPDRTSYVPAAPSYGSCVPGHDVPLAAGGSGNAPHGWGILEHAIGYVWPDGDTGKLRTAATAWSTAGQDLDALSSYVSEAVQAVATQQSPEVDDAMTACTSMSTHITDTAAECQKLSSACSQLAGHVDSAHTAIKNEIVSFLEWSAGIEVVGGLFSVITFGGSEAGAQAVEGTRIAATGARIAEIIRTLITAARAVAETISTVVGRLAEIAGKLKVILGARLTEVATRLVARLPGVAKDAEESAELGLQSASRVASYDFKTERDEAFFWSGRTDGVAGADVAGTHAGSGGGTTLEQLMRERGIKMPEWNPDDPSSIAAWDEASEKYAEGASGTVRAVVGDNLRAGNTWTEYELPALKANPNVTRIVQIDPKTGAQTVLWSR